MKIFFFVHIVNVLYLGRSIIRIINELVFARRGLGLITNNLAGLTNSKKTLLARCTKLKDRILSASTIKMTNIFHVQECEP